MTPLHLHSFRVPRNNLQYILFLPNYIKKGEFKGVFFATFSFLQTIRILKMADLAGKLTAPKKNTTAENHRLIEKSYGFFRCHNSEVGLRMCRSWDTDGFLRASRENVKHFESKPNLVNISFKIIKSYRTNF